MKRTLSIAILALSLAASGALAGQKVFSPFHLDMTGRYASGALGDVRADPDPDVHLRCYSIGWPGTSYGQCVACNAKDCAFAWSFDPDVIASMRSLDSNTALSFHWDTNGELEYLWVETGSQFTPIQP